MCARICSRLHSPGGVASSSHAVDNACGAAVLGRVVLEGAGGCVEVAGRVRGATSLCVPGCVSPILGSPVLAVLIQWPPRRTFDSSSERAQAYGSQSRKVARFGE